MEPLPAREAEPEPETEPPSRIAFAWNRITLVDVALTTAMTYAGIRYWSYLLTRM